MPATASADRPIATPASRVGYDQLLEPIMNESFRKYLIKRCMNIWGLPWYEAEDVVQETYLVMLTRRTYDPSRSKASTYSTWVLRSVMSERVRQRHTAKREHARTCRLESFHNHLRDHKQENPFDLMAEQDANRKALHDIEQILTDRYFSVLSQFYLEGRGQREIAEAEGISHQRVAQIIKRAIEQVHEAMSSDAP